MYTGTLINELIKAVEQAEKRSLQAFTTEEKLEHFYLLASLETARIQPQLLGVA
jgi:hypothetical protein